MGGMTQAVDSGWAKLKIEAAAAEKQARIDSGKDVIVGVNKYKLAQEESVEILEVDNVKVRYAQIARLQTIKARRDAKAVQQALDALTQAAESGQGNLLDLSIKAIRLRATVGEVSDALEKVYGRHRADTQKVTGVYAAAYDSAQGWDKLKGEIADFATQQGRRPRVMIAKLGQDGHDRGAKVVATAFADLVLHHEQPGRLLTYFSDHKDDFRRLTALHPMLAMRELGRLEARLDAAPSGSASQPSLSQAKPPIQPVGRGASVPTGARDPKDISSLAEWESVRRSFGAR